MDSTNGNSWKGKYGNVSFNQLVELLYHYDYTHFTSDNSKSETRFLPLHDGYCKQLTNPQVKDKIKSPKKKIILIVDPFRGSKLRIRTMPNANIEFGPTYENYFSGAQYLLKYTMYDKSIHEGSTCKNYEATNSSYEDCVQMKLMKSFMSSYGCLPPWFPLEEGYLYFINFLLHQYFFHCRFEIYEHIIYLSN